MEDSIISQYISTDICAFLILNEKRVGYGYSARCVAFGGESRLRSEGGRVKDPKSVVGDTERNTNMSIFKRVTRCSFDISETVAMNRCWILT
jgi:hypothetical protein